jgi:chromosome segregation ATPase
MGAKEDHEELVVALGKEIADLKYTLQKERAEHQLAKKALGDQDEPLYEEIGRLETELEKVEKELVVVKTDCRATLTANETEKQAAILELTENLETAESRKKTAQAESRKNKSELDDLKENHAQVVKERDDLQALVEKMKYHQRELVMRPSADADKLRKADLRIEELEVELSDVRTREMDGKQALAQSQEKVQNLEKAVRLGDERYEETLKAKQELEHKKEQLMQDLASANAELAIAKEAASAGVKAGSAAIIAAQENFQRLFTQLSTAMSRPGSRVAERPQLSSIEEIRSLRQDLQHLQVEVEHQTNLVATKDSQLATMRLELHDARREVSATKERADLEKASQLHSSINSDGLNREPQTISEALHKNAEVGQLVIKERAERNLREYADMKALKMKGRLQRAQMYAAQQTTEVNRLSKKLEVAETSASQSNETVDRLTHRVEQLHGILSKQLSGSVEDLMESRATGRARSQESSLPTLSNQTLLPPGSRNASRGASRKVGSRETLRPKGGGTSSAALTQLYDPAPPAGLYSGTTSAAMTLRHSNSRGRA